MKRPFLESLLLRLAEHQLARPWWVLALTVLSLVPALLGAMRLELRTSFHELLPDDKPSVIELQRIKPRLPGNSTLTVAAQIPAADRGLPEDKRIERLKHFADELSPKLRALGPDYVSAVDDGPREANEFFRENKHLYADLEDIQQVHDDVIERYDYEVGKASGFDLGLGEPPPPITAKSLRERFGKKAREAEKKSPGIDGYYIGEDGNLIAILVRTPFGSGDERGFALRQTIRKLAEPIAGSGLEVHFTGNLITSAETKKAISADLASVGAKGVALILGVVFLFFLRVRTLLAMTLTIAVGCLWSFGWAWVTVGYLNTATGFLVSIIAGNGINFGIIYMGRYTEARRAGSDVAEAIRVSHSDTHIATLAAAGAAGIAYGSLAVTDFHGFQHFGIIGGSGMLLCWLATYLALPPILVVSERIRPMFRDGTTGASKLRGFYGYPFAWLSRRFPRALSVFGIITGIGAFALTYHYFNADPLEYNLREIRNERLSPTAAGKMSLRVDKIVGRFGQDGRAMLVDRLDQVAPLVEELERRRDAAPKDRRPFDSVVSIYDLLPDEQAKKLKLLKEIDDRIARARKRDLISDEDWSELEPHLPKALRPIGIGDLPELVARPFSEVDGTRGRIVYVVPTEGRSVYDAHYLFEWADSFRRVQLPSGEVVLGTGDPVIFSDMLISIGEDGPKAVLASLIGTLVVIFVAFRGRRSGWIALIALLVGVAYLIAFFDIMQIKLNFLNFVSIPIGIGIGADYTVNLMKRYDIEGDGRLYRVLVETGGAVVACSLTTTLGYLALMFSINRAVQSFGLAGAASELTTVFAAMLVLPALLFWRAQRRAEKLGDSAQT